MAADRRCSERLRARLAAVDEPSAAESQLLSVLVGDPLRIVARFLLADEDRFCFRLACKTTRDHCDRPVSSAISRAAFLRSRSLAVYACDELPHFMLDDKVQMLALAAAVGCVAVLAELMDVRGCGAAEGLPYRGVVACRTAASHGRLEALVWLRGRGLEWDTSVCAVSSAGGHLEVLRYAREHGCPWDEETCWYAARRGHLGVLRYAREHGCPWDWRVEPRTPYPPCIRAYVEALRLAAQHPAPPAHGD